jgi:hypothetical protein
VKGAAARLIRFFAMARAVIHQMSGLEKTHYCDLAGA